MAKTKAKINEDSEALSTLQPNSAPVDDPKTRTEILSQMIGSLAQVDYTTLTKLHDQVLATIGHEADPAPNSAAENQASIEPKGNPLQAFTGAAPLVSKEDIDAMFTGQELSEEFKDKAQTIFEAALNARVILESEKIKEEIEKENDALLEELTVDMIDKLDSYLSYVAEEWLKENKVAVESSLRNDLTSEFIDGLKQLFSEHYIDIPEDKVDVVEALSKRVDALTEQLNDAITASRELSEIKTGVKKKEIFEEITTGLPLTSIEKMKTLTVGVEFASAEDYKQKLLVIKENYFPAEKPKKTSTQQLTEATEDPVKETAPVSPLMAKYIEAAKRLQGTA